MKIGSIAGFVRRHRFAAGFVCGLAAVYFGRLAINRTTVADYLISPLLASDTAGKADAIVVLGAGVVGECVPNQNGVRRTLLGVRVWREGRAPVMVFTGGGTGPSCPVGVAMAQLARELGVPASNVLVESNSYNTRQNGERSAPMLRQIGAQRVLLVTDRLHMRRSAGVFASLGFDVERASVPIYEGHPDNVSMLTAGMREFLALSYYRWRGWIKEGADATNRNESHESRIAMVPTSGMNPQQTPKTPSRPIVLLGASYAKNWDLRTLSGVEVINRGVAGEQTAELVGRFDRDVVAANPRTVIIWGFINDIFRAAPTESDAATERVRKNYTRMVEQAHASGIETILATEVTVRPKDSWSETIGSWIGWVMGKEAYQDVINRHVMATNRWLVDFAKQKNLLVLDLHNALAEEGGRRRREFTNEDGSHITPAGYAAITAYAKPVLEAHLVR
ncbi:MAG TPA: ElyC/SanA/YdcF family protein [Vicinamibacterales bacterium]|jgi:uncharacterized SAM-binding protein YcdF (DUF218 family)/lysophospholipase L1-like esterase